MVDFITKLPLIAGKYMVLVVCDRLSKMTHFVAMMEEKLAENLARLFRDNVWELHRLPETIVSDRGLQFPAEMTKRLTNILGIKIKLLMSYHPQTDGQTECIN